MCSKLPKLQLKITTVAPYLPGVGRDGSRAAVVVVSVQEEGISQRQVLALSGRVGRLLIKLSTQTLSL